MRHVVKFAAIMCLVAMPAAAAGISVPMDEVRTVTFDRPVATVYVGNPSVVDVTMIDPTHAFVLGKAYGATNLLALDSKGTQIADEPVTVLGRSEAVVTLNKGATQVTYACASSRCETAPLPGDATTAYEAQTSQNAVHQELGVKAASTH